MIRSCTLVILAFTLLLSPLPAWTDAPVRFAAVDIYLDSPEPFAAWQFELSDRNGSMRVVGVENGDSPAFSDAPYYDRDAVSNNQADRIIVADFSLNGAADLPSGRIRIATIHIVVSGSAEPDFDLQLVTATGPDGTVVGTSIELNISSGKER